MKKEMAFMSAMIVLGVSLGIGIILIIAAIAVPDFGKMLLTLKEKADFELMYQQTLWIIDNLQFVPYVLLALAIVAFVLLLVNLNPHIKGKLRIKRPGLKFLVIILGLFACFIILFFMIRGFNFFDIDPSKSPSALGFVFFAAIGGVLWLIAGEMGWAGDFSSWKMGVAGREPRPFLTFILGAVVGFLTYELILVYNWAFFKYFIVVSEVLDQSGETSYLGFKLLAYELMFTTGISFAIIAGLTVALAPVYRTMKERARWFVVPLILSAIYAGVIIVEYKNAEKKYDLDKKDLAQAAGVPDKASESLSLVLLKQDAAVVQEWPLQVKASGFASTSVVAATPESLRKIDEYLVAHKDGSVFTYVSQDALIRGYHAMWDVEKGIEYQFRYADQVLIHRLIMLSRLRYLPVTQKNLNYLKAFTDESKWYAGRDACLRIAEAFMHFGMTKEAQEWVNRGKERGADMSKTGFLKEKVLTQGRIQGRVLVNGTAPVNAKAALVRQDYRIDKIEDFSFVHKLVDVQEIGRDGSFAFSNLGKGEYLIVIVADKKVIPYNIAPDKLKVKNLPGPVKIEANKPTRDLGTVNITWNQR